MDADRDVQTLIRGSLHLTESGAVWWWKNLLHDTYDSKVRLHQRYF